MTHPTERRRLLDAEGAAAYLTVGLRLVRRTVRERRIAFVMVGRLVRFDPDDLE